MKVIELYHVLRSVINANVDAGENEIRIGDQVESGPYLHASVGGVFKGTQGEIILCANDDDQWREEPTGVDHDLPVLWKPQS